MHYEQTESNICRCLRRLVDDWLFECFFEWHLRDKAIALWSRAFRALLWNLWLERNLQSFENKAMSLDSFCDVVRIRPLGGVTKTEILL